MNNPLPGERTLKGRTVDFYPLSFGEGWGEANMALIPALC